MATTSLPKKGFSVEEYLALEVEAARCSPSEAVEIAIATKLKCAHYFSKSN